MGRVSGKVAIVTGAARGMGAAHARRLIEEGAKVMLTDVLDKEGAAMAASLGTNAHFLHHDVAQETQWKHIVAETEARFGPVSVLVNNAGIAYVSALEETEESAYRHVIDVDQISVFLGMKSVIPSMKRAGSGSIINISSTSGMIGSAGAIAYTAAKFAVRGMSKAAAVELAPLNIRVNSVHPGVTRTPIVDIPEAQEVLKTLCAGTPAGRIGEPDEIAAVVLMLASDEAKFSTGAEFVVDGGLTCQ